jgi:hypothetical protein
MGTNTLERPSKVIAKGKSAALDFGFGGARHQKFNVRSFCTTYNVKQDAFTRLAGFSPRAVSLWAMGRTPSLSTQRRLSEITRLFLELRRLVDARQIGPWLRTSNPAFEGSTPLQVIERGETDRIWRMIYELKSGQPG